MGPTGHVTGFSLPLPLSNATNTHSEYIIFTAFPLQQWLHKRA